MRGIPGGDYLRGPVNTFRLFSNIDGHWSSKGFYQTGSIFLWKYKYSTSDTFLDFLFESKGPKGCVKKVVSYTLQNDNGIPYFNLGFGDLNPLTGKVDDLAITNNEDREKVLATIAATVIEFTRHFPHALVYASGSTPARTRLYQMGIASNWDEIDSILYVYGYEENTGWQLFQKNIRYQAFLVRCK